jgi:hypothetical protein
LSFVVSMLMLYLHFSAGDDRAIPINVQSQRPGKGGLCPDTL